jgi:hypothetical protein
MLSATCALCQDRCASDEDWKVERELCRAVLLILRAIIV